MKPRPVGGLPSADCPITGKLFAVQGGLIAECDNWRVGKQFTTEGAWSIDSVTEALGVGAAA